MDKKQVDHDLYVGIGLLLFEIFCFYETYSFKIAETTAKFPRLVLGVMMGLTVLLIIKSVKKTMQGNGEKRFSWGESKVSLGAYVIMVGYVLIFWKVNYIVAAPILLIALFWYLKFRDLKKVIPIIIGYVILVYLIFVQMLGQYRLVKF